MYKVCGILIFFLLPTVSASYISEVLADNPLHFWRLGETSGSVAVDEISGKNGTYSGSLNLGVPGALGGSDTGVNFNNGQVIITNVADFPSTALSVEFWMQSSETTLDSTIFSYGVAGFFNEFLIFDAPNFNIHINEGAAGASGVLGSDGNLNHIVVTWNSADGQVKIYKNGVHSSTQILSAGSPLTSGGTIVLGQEQDALGGGFDAGQRYTGLLDEVALYSTVLSDERILAHFNGDSALPVPEPSTYVLLILASLVIGYRNKRQFVS